MRTLIAGGGTGGHLTPALAVAHALQSSEGVDNVVLVTRKTNAGETLLKDSDIPQTTLDVRGIDASRPLGAARTMSRIPTATLAAARTLHRFKPDVVVGTGGHVSVPVVMAARLQRLPVVLLEQNVMPGRATRLLARTARVVASSFVETAARLPKARVVYTGNPVREEILAKSGTDTDDQRECRHILVLGGSQGSHRLNVAMMGCVEPLLATHSDVTVTHQCGAADLDSVQDVQRSLPAEFQRRYTLAAFFDNLAELLPTMDAVVMRAGASSLAECSAMGLAMILVPYPHARAHQQLNAQAYVRQGAATMIADGECTAEHLREQLEQLIASPQRWRAMSGASQRAARLDATARVVALIKEVATS